MLRNHLPVLEAAKEDLCDLIPSYPGFQATILDSLDQETVDSILGDRESILSTTEFTFDQELINTRTYRRQLARMKRSGKRPAKKSGTSSASDSESSGERLPNIAEEMEDLIDLSFEPAASQPSLPFSTPTLHADLEGLMFGDAAIADTSTVKRQTERAAQNSGTEVMSDQRRNDMHRELSKVVDLLRSNGEMLPDDIVQKLHSIIGRSSETINGHSSGDDRLAEDRRPEDLAVADLDQVQQPDEVQSMAEQPRESDHETGFDIRYSRRKVAKPSPWLPKISRWSATTASSVASPFRPKVSRWSDTTTSSGAYPFPHLESTEYEYKPKANREPDMLSGRGFVSASPPSDWKDECAPLPLLDDLYFQDNAAPLSGERMLGEPAPVNLRFRDAPRPESKWIRGPRPILRAELAPLKEQQSAKGGAQPHEAVLDEATNACAMRRSEERHRLILGQRGAQEVVEKNDKPREATLDASTTSARAILPDRMPHAPTTRIRGPREIMREREARAAQRAIQEAAKQNDRAREAARRVIQEAAEHIGKPREATPDAFTASPRGIIPDRTSPTLTPRPTRGPRTIIREPAVRNVARHVAELHQSPLKDGVLDISAIGTMQSTDRTSTGGTPLSNLQSQEAAPSYPSGGAFLQNGPIEPHSHPSLDSGPDAHRHIVLGLATDKSRPANFVVPLRYKSGPVEFAEPKSSIPSIVKNTVQLPGPVDIPDPDDKAVESHSIPEDGTPVTLRTRGGTAKSRSQNSLLIEYFEGGKDPSATSGPKPSVRVRVVPSKKTDAGHLTVTEVRKGDEKKAQTSTTIPLSSKGDKDAGKFLTPTHERQSDSRRRSRSDGREAVLGGQSRPGLESDQIGSQDEAKTVTRYYCRHAIGFRENSELDVPIDDCSDCLRSKRYRTKSGALRHLHTKHMKPESGLLRAPERWIGTREVPDLVAKTTAEEPRRRRRSSRNSEEATPGSSAKRTPMSSNRSINNPKLLETVQEAIERLILPELNALKREQARKGIQRRSEEVFQPTEADVPEPEPASRQPLAAYVEDYESDSEAVAIGI
jgi:hypothetical protein